jgi:hypothetical protein
VNTTTSGIVRRRPRVGELFRVHPGGERRAATWVAYDHDTGEPYLVVESLWRDHSGLVPVCLRACENDRGERFIWCIAIGQALAGGGPNPELLLADTAERMWCSPRPVLGSFETLAPGVIPEPAWDSFDFLDAIHEAFEGRVVTSADHPILIELRRRHQASARLRS